MAAVGQPRFAGAASELALVGQLSGALSVASAGGRAIVGMGPRLGRLDLADPTRPQLAMGHDLLPEVVQDVAVAGAADAAGDLAVDAVQVLGSGQRWPSPRCFDDRSGCRWGLQIQALKG
jgi:hypothetical protein